MKTSLYPKETLEDLHRDSYLGKGYRHSDPDSLGRSDVYRWLRKSR